MAFAQENSLSAPAAESPVPFRLMVAVGFVVASLAIRIDPVAAPAQAGSKVT